MRVLVACEFSQVVTKAFRERGHEAYSCDILPTEGNPDWHLQCDVLDILDLGWDMMIAHPPCTYLCVPGAHYLNKQPGRYSKMIDAKLFFIKLLNSNINKICVENPVPHKKAELPKYDQIIQPWMFGDPFSKRTCLWLKNISELIPTNIIQDHGERYYRKDGSVSNSMWYAKASQKERSRTFSGIADAMADQWGCLDA